MPADAGWHRRKASSRRAHFSKGTSVRDSTLSSATQSSCAPEPFSHTGRPLTRMLPIEEHGFCSASRNDASDLLVVAQRRHVEQQLLGVHAFRVEQDQIDAEAIELVARPVVEQEQRPAALVGVLQLVELDQELGFRRRPEVVRQRAGRARRRPAPSWRRRQRIREVSLISMAFRAPLAISSRPTQVASEERSSSSSSAYTERDALSSAWIVTPKLRSCPAPISRRTWDPT